MIYALTSPRRFKRENLANWRNNTEFWLRARLPHIEHLEIALLAKLEGLFIANRVTRIYDLGCGEGWILRLLLDSVPRRWQYLGIDFNKKIIDALKRNYNGDNVAFCQFDLESRLPDRIAQKADIAIGCLSLFEMPQLAVVLRNVYRCMAKAGYFIAVNIDPVMQILSISKTLSGFRRNLKLYERFGSRLAYNKHIDTTKGQSRRIYKGILYSHQAIIQGAMSAGFALRDYADIKALSANVPQIYQLFVFQRRDAK